MLLTTEFERSWQRCSTAGPKACRGRGARQHDYDAFFRALDNGTARLALRLEAAPGMNEPLTDEYTFANRARERLLGARIINLAPPCTGCGR